MFAHLTRTIVTIYKLRKRMRSRLLLFVSLLVFFICFPSFLRSQRSQNVLVADEVATLKTIFDALRKTDWDFSVDPCSLPFRGEIECNCSDPTGCHVSKLFLSHQNLTGTLPKELENLRILRGIDLGGNRLTGSIPREIGNISTLVYLYLYNNLLSGTLPQELSQLPLVLIIDLGGNQLTGSIPIEFGNISTLRQFDVGFNKLDGPIPTSFANLQNLNFMYLTGNLLTGDVPNWMGNSKTNIDLSYNNFSIGNSGMGCQVGSLNTFRMESPLETKNSYVSGITSCMRSYTCPANFSSFHINCGGEGVDINSTTYDGDTDLGGAAKFYRSGSNWAYSSTGNFPHPSSNPYIATANATLNMTESELYMNARVSPISLTYYGFCLANGNYTVILRFAEIVYTSTNGTRLFDVYIQGNLVLKNFNIEDASGGVGKVVTRSFNTSVFNTTIEIRFYTTRKAIQGIYGPLISAISVVSNTKPPNRGNSTPPQSGNSIPMATLIGIVVAVASLSPWF